MKKILMVAGLLSSITVSQNATAGWYGGVGVGWKSGRFNGNFTGTDVSGPAGPSEEAKGKFSQDSFLGGVFLGHSFKGSMDWFVQLNASYDADKKSKKKLDLPGASGISDAEMKVRRVGSFGLDLGVTKNMKGLDFSLKVGAMISKFDVGFEDLTVGNNEFAPMGTRYVLGFAPGFGVEKKVGPVDIGLKYEYQMYNQLSYSSTQRSESHEGVVKTNPRYHVVALTFKKEF